MVRMDRAEEHEADGECLKTGQRFPFQVKGLACHAQYLLSRSLSEHQDQHSLTVLSYTAETNLYK